MVYASEGNKCPPKTHTLPRNKSITILTEGSEFLTSNSQKGFSEYVNQTGLIQNKNVDYNTSVKEVSWIDGTEGNDWIAAPSNSTHNGC